MVISNREPIPNEASHSADALLGVEDFKWDPTKPEESLQCVYMHDVTFAKRKIRWYYDEAEKNGRYSKGIRLSAITLLTLGALCPLIEATGLDRGMRLSAWGYVLFALAAGLFALDRFYGLSTSWTRNTATWLAIRRALVDFEHDWLLSTGRQPSDWREGVKILKEFRAKIEAAVIEETTIWVLQEERARKALQDSLDRASPSAD